MAAPVDTDGFRIRTVSTAVLAGAGLIYVLRLAAPLLVPLFVALLLAYALEPLVAALVRSRVPRPLAAAAVFFLVAVLVGSVGRTATIELSSFLDDLPAALEDARAHGARHPNAPGPLASVQEAAAALSTPSPAPVDQGVKRVTVVSSAFDVREYLAGATRGVLTSIVQAAVVGLLAFLLLATGDLYKRKLVRLAGPTWANTRVTLGVIRQIDDHIERYLFARVLISAIVAIGTAIPLWILGVERPVMWGLVAGALNVVPLIGPSVAVACVAAAAFLQFRALGPTAAAAAAATIVAAIEGNVITPWMMGRAGELNTVAVFVSVLFWGWMWDVWGLLLAVPMTVAVKAAADRIEPLTRLGELLGR
jgi:predicted PurR-regulated permease PerM